MMETEARQLTGEIIDRLVEDGFLREPALSASEPVAVSLGSK
jgi:hypothetical protein